MFLTKQIIKKIVKKKLNEIENSTNKSFGIVFSIFFLLVFLWPIFKNEDLRTWALIPSIIFLVLGLSNSKLLTPLNIIWNKLGILLGKFVSPIVMGIIFFLVITPIGFFSRALGKDFLRLKKNNNKNTYWIEKDNYKTSMKKQF